MTTGKLEHLRMHFLNENVVILLTVHKDFFVDEKRDFRPTQSAKKSSQFQVCNLGEVIGV